jgi:hypothetical protein
LSIHRCKDQIFLTWNGTKGELQSVLDSLARQYPNVQMEIKIGSSVEYLNAFIENQKGQLYSRVYHDTSVQAYTLPYVMGHAKVEYSYWLRKALVRAVYYCSAVQDFQKERIYLEMSCLINGLSILFVETHVKHFFKYFNGESMRFCTDQNKYHSFRCQIFDFLEAESEHVDRLQKQHDHDQLIRFHYIYEHGARCYFNEKFHQIWSHYLAPIFLTVARQTTVINSIDIIRKLQHYVLDGHLKVSTQFITMDVTDLYTMIPRQGALEALGRFCMKHSKQGRIGTLSIDHIMRMARLILDSNCFAYNDKYYRQIRGGAMGSAFTQVLANIYMLEWEQDLIEYQISDGEIYGRFVDH